MRLPSNGHRLFPSLLLPAVLLAAIAACGDEDATGPTRGGPRGIQFVALSMPVDLSPDGSVAAIQDGSSASGDLYFFHPATGALEFRTRVGDPLRTFATGLSANGMVSALHNEPVQAGFWSDAAEWTDISTPYLAGCGSDLAGAWDISADARVLVGLVWNGCNAEAFRWDATGSGIMVPLERLGEPFTGSTNPPANRATVVSDDGSVAAGWAQTSLVDRWPAIWQSDGTGFQLPAGGFGADAPGEVLSISADGKMVAGTWGGDGFYWTAASGTVNLGKLPGSDPFFGETFANAVAANGAIIFGGSGNPFFTVPQAFVWTQAHGMRPLARVAANHGVTIPEGYLLTTVLAASADGGVVMGVAYTPNFQQVTFVLTLPVSAYGP